LPESDLHKSELAIYRLISNYTSPRPGIEPTNGGVIPPLMVAFILDTSDIPNGQALMWQREAGKVTLDTGSISGKGKGKDQRTGIVLERWTLRST